MRLISLIKSILLICVLSGPCLSDNHINGKNDKYFFEYSYGRGFAEFKDLDFLNPIGKSNTTNATNGDYIILNNLEKNSETQLTSLGVGKIFDNTVYSLNYSTLGNLSTKGYATFSGTAYDQVLNTNTKILSISGGLHQNFGKLFFEPKLELGVGISVTTGTQGREVSGTGSFPDNTEYHLVSGISLSLGYEIMEDISLIADFGYLSLGVVKTGKVGGTPPSGMNTGEQLLSELSVSSVSLILRYMF